ncbi:c-type cytochrome [Uliginosibacterium gangwonense]|uniref:c-type cytochrome n=1 Tax=Uliginosibacterium gangwonense TaxID=392736 RepID=UPI00037D8CDC|nr:cytochrome c peroxidase [Uliginosibacterium gangwonense]
MKLDSTARRVLITTGLALAASMAFAQTNLAASTVRPSGYKPLKGDPEAGKVLFNDTKLSTNGMSCASCHANHGAFSTSFAKPYPHMVVMARDRLSLKSVNLDEMVQACMVIPMAAKLLPWNSKELANLTTYVAELQKTFKPAY